MRILQSSIIRAICAIVVGYLLVMYRTEMVQWLTIATGALFFISGLVSVIAYYAEKRKAQKTAERLAAMAEMREGKDAPENPEDIERAMRPPFPIVGLGSVILGVILAMMPTTFINGVMYVLAAILILGAINQYFNLAGIRKISTIPFLFWVFPTIILGVGIFMLVKPMEMSALPFRILGWCLMFYGVVECVNSIKIYKAKKEYEDTQRKLEQASVEDVIDTSKIEDAEVIETEPQ
jgi:uncharacterized membrane protein HdeD (DUF308 family)